jgi:hypothetical protein
MRRAPGKVYSTVIMVGDEPPSELVCLKLNVGSRREIFRSPL